MKTIQLTLALVFCLCAVHAQLSQKQQRPDPVPILKQISKQNDDGSYSFGYEAGDGSYKIETKFPDGEVQGKYGYVDDEGKLREVEYGAGSKSGFRPQGNGINVPPPSATRELNLQPLAEGEEDDGQYREDPSIYDTKDYINSRPVQKVSRRPAFTSTVTQPLVSYQEEEPIQRQPQRQQQVQQPQPTFQRQQFKFTQPQYATNNYQQPQQVDYQQQTYQQPQTYQTYQQPQTYQRPQTFQFRSNTPSFNTYQQPSQNLDYQPPQQTYSVFQQQPAYQQRYQAPQQPQFASFNLHPSVKNLDLGSGSYSINYGR